MSDEVTTLLLGFFDAFQEWEATYDEMSVEVSSCKDQNLILLIKLPECEIRFSISGEPDKFADNFNVIPYEWQPSKNQEEIFPHVSIDLSEFELLTILQKMLLYHIRALAFMHVKRHHLGQEDAQRNLKTLKYISSKINDKNHLKILDRIGSIIIKRFVKQTTFFDGDDVLFPSIKIMQNNNNFKNCLMSTFWDKN